MDLDRTVEAHAHTVSRARFGKRSLEPGILLRWTT